MLPPLPSFRADERTTRARLRAREDPNEEVDETAAMAVDDDVTAADEEEEGAEEEVEEEEEEDVVDEEAEGDEAETVAGFRAPEPYVLREPYVLFDPAAGRLPFVAPDVRLTFGGDEDANDNVDDAPEPGILEEGEAAGKENDDGEAVEVEVDLKLELFIFFARTPKATEVLLRDLEDIEGFDFRAMAAAASLDTSAASAIAAAAVAATATEAETVGRFPYEPPPPPAVLGRFTGETLVCLFACFTGETLGLPLLPVTTAAATLAADELAFAPVTFVAVVVGGGGAASLLAPRLGDRNPETDNDDDAEDEVEEVDEGDEEEEAEDMNSLLVDAAEAAGNPKLSLLLLLTRLPPLLPLPLQEPPPLAPRP